MSAVVRERQGGWEGRGGERRRGRSDARSSLTLETLFFAGALNCQFMGKSEQSISGVRRREHNCPAPSHLDQIVSFNPHNSSWAEVGEWAVGG